MAWDQGKGWSRAAEWYAAGLLLVYGVVLFAHSAAPSLTDYANWTYQGELLARHLRGLPDAVHALKPYPVPNSAATLGVGLLALVLPWKIAAKVWLCGQLLISFMALRHLVRTLGRSGAVWMIVPQAVFLNVNFWYGFMNFELGLCWVLLVASILLRRVQGRGGPAWMLGAVLLLAFFTHMIPFAFCGLLVVLYAAQTGRWRVLWQVVPGGLATAWYLAGRYLLEGNADGQAGMVAAVRTYSGAFWAYKVNSYLKSFGFVNPGSVDGSVAVAVLGRVVFAGLFAVNLALCVVLGWAMARAARRAYAERLDERFLWTGILLLVPLYVLAPGTALGVSDPGSRLLQVALALGLVLCCARGWGMRWAGVGAALLGVAGVVLFAWVGFGAEKVVSTGKPLPHAVVIFGHVPNHDQDYFYGGMEQGNMGLAVFPTGMFLNKGESRPQMRTALR